MSWKLLKWKGDGKRNVILALVALIIAAAILVGGMAAGGYWHSHWPEPSVAFQASFRPTAPFPMDPSVSVGRLDNGLTYYIVPNEDPADRILLTLVVNAGSLNEDDDQKGVAHFLEHMMFNGTRHFTTEHLRKYFEANGIPMGQHLNAYTTYEQTVYHVSIDKSQPEAVDAAFTLLSDWSQGSLLLPEEVEREKGVVEEEWRLYQEDAWDRTWDLIWGHLLNGSLYDERDVIGDIKVIRSLFPDLLRRFQEDWYRPDLMTVIIIGEVDLEWAEKQIQRHFALSPMPVDVRQPIEAQIPVQTKGHIEIRTDPELTEVWLQVLQLKEAHPIETLDDYRQVLVADLTRLLLFFRLDDLQDISEARYEDMWTDLERQDFGAATLASMGTRLNEKFLLTGLTEVLTALRRTQLKGFTRKELDNAKYSIIQSHEDRLKDSQIRHNSEIQEEVLAHLTSGFPLAGAAFDLDLVRHYLPDISLREVNIFMARFLSPEDSLIFLSAPDKPNLSLPSTYEIGRILAQQRIPLPWRSYLERQPDVNLLSEIPEPVDPVKQEWNPRLALHELTYANGVKALLKYNDTEENEVIIDLSNQGGRSHVDNDSFYSAFLTADVGYRSGASHLDGDSIDRFLGSTSIFFEPYLTEAAEGYYAETDAEDLETLFQLLYLYRTEPRFDEKSFLYVLDDYRAELRNQILDPHFVLLDQITAVRYPNSPRLRPMLLADLAEVDFAKAQDIYTERFAAMDAPILAMVGNFELAEAKRLISTYVGTLTFSEVEETWQDQSVATQPGPLRKYINHGEGSQVLVEQAFGHSQVSDLDRSDSLALRALARILNSRLTHLLREELGGTYHVDVYVWLQTGPHAGANLVIRFATNEKHMEILMDTSRSVMQELRENGVIAEELAAARAELLTELKADRISNYYWVNALIHEFIYRSGNLDQIDRDEEYLENLTLSQVNELVPVILNVDRLIELALVPENHLPESLTD